MRIDGPNLHLRYLETSEVEPLRDAVQGFWPDGRMPSTRELFKFRHGVGLANDAMFDRTQLTPDTPVHEAVYAVCLSSNYSIIGYNITLYEGTRMSSMMTAILPEQRNFGHYRELIYLRHRLGFDVLKAENSHMKLPIEGDSAIKRVLDTVYSETIDTFQFQNTMWRLGSLSKDRYQTYLEGAPHIAAIPWEIDW